MSKTKIIIIHHSLAGLFRRFPTSVSSLTTSSTGTADMLGKALAREAPASGTVGILKDNSLLVFL